MIKRFSDTEKKSETHHYEMMKSFNTLIGPKDPSFFNQLSDRLKKYYRSCQKSIKMSNVLSDTDDYDSNYSIFHGFGGFTTRLLTYVFDKHRDSTEKRSGDIEFTKVEHCFKQYKNVIKEKDREFVTEYSKWKKYYHKDKHDSSKPISNEETIRFIFQTYKFIKIILNYK